MMKPVLILALLAAALIAADKPGDTAATDQQKIQGAWHFVQFLQGDMDKTEENKTLQLVFDGDKFSVKDDQKTLLEGTFTLIPEKSPPQIDFLVQKDPDNQSINQKALAIYRLEGPNLKICSAEAGQTGRPASFDAKGTDFILVTMERKKK